MRNSILVYLLQFKRANIYLLSYEVFETQKFRSSLAGWVWCQSLWRGCRQDLGVGENVYKMTHPHDWWQESVVCLLVARGLFSPCEPLCMIAWVILMSWQLVFPEQVMQETSQEEVNVFYNLASEVTCHHMCIDHIDQHRYTLGGITQVNIRRWWSWGIIWGWLP